MSEVAWRNVTLRATDRLVYSPKVEREPQAGDVYRLVLEVRTVGGDTYAPGTLFTLVEKTTDAPHGYVNPQGNFRVQVEGRVTVWSSIHGMIADGYLQPAHAAPGPSRFDREDPV
jgi:hypothetical protein